MLGLLNNEKLIVGFDLGEDYSQISYCEMDGKPETLSLVAGAENYNIPTVLCKREGVNQWFYGREALRFAQEKQGILVKNLLQMALDGESVQIDGNVYDPVALLTLFVKRCIGMLAHVASADKMDALMITCESLNHRMLEVLSQVVVGLKMKLSTVSFQSHTESFYNYMIHQPMELWESPTMLLDYRKDRMVVYRMERNRRTTPIVVYIGKEEYPFPEYMPVPESEALRKEKMERLDRELMNLAVNVCGNDRISAVYLIGEHYSDEWLKESLRFLCRGRRIFVGSNLYSKGACYGMQERLHVSEVGKNHVFLGNDKLKANIGMKILRRGEESYYALLDAGINWFEAEHTIEFYLQDGNEIQIMITPLIGKERKFTSLVLEELSGNLSRMRMHLFLQEENRLVAEVTDLGLGEIRPGTERVWREEIELYD